MPRAWHDRRSSGGTRTSGGPRATARRRLLGNHSRPAEVFTPRRVDHRRDTFESRWSPWSRPNHPAHEAAVSAYFDFAHALSVQARLYEVGLEMEALAELVTDGPVTEQFARDFVFPGLIWSSPLETSEGVPGDRNAQGASFSEEAVPHMDACTDFPCACPGPRRSRRPSYRTHTFAPFVAGSSTRREPAVRVGYLQSAGTCF